MSSRQVLLGVSAIVFVASAAMTIATSASMSTMGSMWMPGGWTMSHMWMVMPDQSWLGGMTSFVSMWVVMMVAMMLPSLMPTLLGFHASLGSRMSPSQAGGLTAMAAVAYFAVWATLGVLIFPSGVAVTRAAMQEPSIAGTMPLIAGVMLLVVGILQQSAWKARYLARCRDASAAGAGMRIGVSAAWHHGLCLGLHCVRSCAGLTVVMLCLGTMDLRVMGATAVAVTAERLAPNGMRAARLIGAGVMAIGLSALVGWHGFG